MEDRINTLYIWLQQNGFHKEASLVDESLYGSDLVQNKPDLKVVLDPQQQEQAWEALHLTLDFTGLIPGAGEPADLINAVLYAVRQKYFEAALSLLALVPGLGIAATLLKRANKASDVAEVLARAAKTSGLSPSDISRHADNSLDLLRKALEDLKNELPREYAAKIPADALPKVKAQIDQIIGAIKESSADPGIGRRYVRQVANSASENSWRELSREHVSTLKQISKAAAEKALLRSSDYLGPLLKPKISKLFPDLSENMIAAITRQCYEDISNISITLVDTISDMHRVFKKGVDNTVGSYKLSENAIYINLPFVAAFSSKHGFDKASVQLFSTIKHEINHNLDEIIGSAYHKIIGIPVAGFDGNTGERLRYISDLMRNSPMSRDKSFSGIAGTLLGDSIDAALRKGALIGDSYLRDNGEVMTRFVNLKGFINNRGPFNLAEQIFADQPSFLLKNRELYSYLGEAHTGDPLGFLKFITDPAVASNWGEINKSLGKIDYGIDVADFKEMINPEALKNFPHLIMDIYNAV